MKNQNNSNSTAAIADEKIYRIAEVIGDKKKGISGLIPMCRTLWYRGISQGRHPRPVKIGLRASGWRGADIKALLASYQNAG